MSLCFVSGTLLLQQRTQNETEECTGIYWCMVLLVLARQCLQRYYRVWKWSDDSLFVFKLWKVYSL